MQEKQPHICCSKCLFCLVSRYVVSLTFKFGWEVYQMGVKLSFSHKLILRKKVIIFIVFLVEVFVSDTNRLYVCNYLFLWMISNKLLSSSKITTNRLDFVYEYQWTDLWTDNQNQKREDGFSMYTTFVSPLHGEGLFLWKFPCHYLIHDIMISSDTHFVMLLVNQGRKRIQTIELI